MALFPFSECPPEIQYFPLHFEQSSLIKTSIALYTLAPNQQNCFQNNFHIRRNSKMHLFFYFHPCEQSWTICILLPTKCGAILIREQHFFRYYYGATCSIITRSFLAPMKWIRLLTITEMIVTNCGNDPYAGNQYCEKKGYQSFDRMQSILFNLNLECAFSSSISQPQAWFSQCIRPVEVFHQRIYLALQETIT